MTAIARPPIEYRVPVAHAFRRRHRTTEAMVHKIGPGGRRTAEGCAEFFLRSPEGVATTSVSGNWTNKVPLFYGWAREGACPTCGVGVGAYCLSEKLVRRYTPHIDRLGVVPQAHLDKASVPYHILIEPSGAIYQYLPLDARGAHARRSNGRSIGIACVGDYDKEKPSAPLLNSLRWVLKWLALDEHTVLLTNQDQGLLVVRGHDEVRDQPKACPGRYLLPEVANLNPWLEGVKRQLAFRTGGC